MKTTRIKSTLRHFVWLSVVGIALLACILQSEMLLLPYVLEPVGRALFRGAFLVTLPFRLFVVPIIPSVNHHWPLSHWVVTCLGTPYFLYSVGKFCLAIGRSWRRRFPVSHADAGKNFGVYLNRREFLARSTAGATAAVTGSVGSYATLVEPARLYVREYTIPVKGLPAVFDNLRIAHVSDTHYGPYVALSFVQEAIGRANELNPDLVLLTGDFVHFTPRSVEDGIGVLAGVEARLGAAAVMGNHEHWEGAEACRERFSQIGMPLLENRAMYVTAQGLTDAPKAGEPSFCLAGVGDLWEGEVLLDETLKDAPADVPCIMLSHNPDVAEMLKAHHRVDLMLSGHTHGGQVSLPVVGPLVVPSEYGEKYLGGLCQGPRCPVVVSRGVGVAGIPVRFGVPPEIGLITLRCA